MPRIKRAITILVIWYWFRLSIKKSSAVCYEVSVPIGFWGDLFQIKNGLMMMKGPEGGKSPRKRGSIQPKDGFLPENSSCPANGLA
jgi:hypothetical protein